MSTAATNYLRIHPKDFELIKTLLEAHSGRLTTIEQHMVIAEKLDDATEHCTVFLECIELQERSGSIKELIIDEEENTNGDAKVVGDEEE
jgi:hypothetical protein